MDSLQLFKKVGETKFSMIWGGKMLHFSQDLEQFFTLQNLALNYICNLLEAMIIMEN